MDQGLSQPLWHTNFKRIISGQMLSVFATSILRFALSLYLLDLTQSASTFGFLMGVSLIPMALLSPLAGVLADRCHKQKMMVAMDLTYGILGLLLILAVTMNSSVPVFAVILIILSIVSTCETPVVQSSLPLIQAENNLVKANALVSQVGMLGNLIGPILAGILYGMMTIKYIFFFSACLFFLAALIELFIKIPFEKRAETGSALTSIKSDLVDCWEFLTKKEKTIFNTIVMVASISFFTSGLVTVGVPYIIRLVFQLESYYLGLTEAMLALAGIIGGVLVSIFGRYFSSKRLSGLMLFASICLFTLAVLFHFQRGASLNYYSMTGVFMVMQLIFTIFSIMIVSDIQMRTPNELLGKVMSFMTMLIMLCQPLAQASYGILFEWVGTDVQIIFLGTGLCLLAIGGWSGSKLITKKELNK